MKVVTFTRKITIGSFKRGFHIITPLILNEFPEINHIDIGIMHLLLKHTSASLTLNENVDSTVREDFESFFNTFVPENSNYFKHTLEGKDDMPAHLKSSVIGSEISIPISKGKLNLGTWQGIYFCEHRNSSSSREIIVTIIGKE